jgi:hypothetical protein
MNTQILNMSQARALARLFSSASNQRATNNNYKADLAPPLALAQYRKVPVFTGKYGTGIYR